MIYAWVLVYALRAKTRQLRIVVNNPNNAIALNGSFRGSPLYLRCFCSGVRSTSHAAPQRERGSTESWMEVPEAGLETATTELERNPFERIVRWLARMGFAKDDLGNPPTGPVA